MAIVWYYRAEDGLEQGPVNSSQLKRLADFGKVKPTTQVRLAEQDRWEPASQVDGLFPEAASKGPASPAPSTYPAPTPFAAPSPAPAAMQPQMAAPMYGHPAGGGYSPAAQPNLAPGPSAGLEWYCQLSGRQLGPLRPEELRDLARMGRLAPDAPVARGAHGPWYPARELAPLLGLNWQNAPAMAMPMQQPMAMPVAMPMHSPAPVQAAYVAPAMYVAQTVPAEPAQPTVVATPAVRSAPARVSDLPQTQPVFVILLIGGIALGVIGVGVAAYVISSLGSRPTARTLSNPEAASRVELRVHEPLAPRVDLPDRESPVGLHGRPKERGDRFQDFARQAENTKWVPDADPETKEKITQREKRIAELLIELSADFVTEPLEEDFKQLRDEYLAQKITPQFYLESLDNLQKVLRRPAKGAKP